jgi:apolipoprotein N-acyltransferase
MPSPDLTPRFSLRELFLSMLTGLLLTASFAPFRFDFLAWFALAPLLVNLNRASLKKAFWLGFIAGAVHYVTLIYWITVVLGHYGGMNIITSLGPFILLTSYLALFPAVFASLITFIKGHRFYLIMIASCWVGLEYARACLLTGFPWCLLGYTQYKNLEIIQIADLCGVYGLSFLIVLVNGLIWGICSLKTRKTTLWQEAIIIFLIIGLSIGYGHYRLSQNKAEDHNQLQTTKILVVQGNIDQSIKWNPSFQAETIQTYKRLTHSGKNFKPDIIVWPETSAPFFFQNNNRLSKEIVSIAGELNATLVFGSPAYQNLNGKLRYYNRAYLITPGERQHQHYDKVRLVPFGEYVPFKKILGFINRLVPAAGDFEAGMNIKPMTDQGLKMGVLICFEAIFPELARSYSRAGANIFFNITNDAWFGKTSAPYQHLCMSVIRAVENRIPLIRSANTGFSAVILPNGEIISKTELFEESILQTSIVISPSKPTFYARFGDILPIFLITLSVIAVLGRLLKTSKKQFY